MPYNIDLLQKLEAIRDKGSQALKALEMKPSSVKAEAEVWDLTTWIKEELEWKYFEIHPDQRLEYFDRIEPYLSLAQPLPHCHHVQCGQGR